MLIKVCGMTRPEDVAGCVGLGVDLVGFIFAAKSPRCVEPAFAARFEGCGAERVGVFTDHPAAEVRRIMDEGRLDLAQLHGGQDEAFCREVGVDRVIKVFWPERYPSRHELEADLARFAGCARFFLLDAGTSGGGHGRAMDFSRIEGLKAPGVWLLAGGLGPGNVVDAVGRCSPGGLDLNSGVEDAPGVKSMDKLAAALALLGRSTDKRERP